jgi:Gram-negative bacterial TonB protein C-terminal
MKSGLRAVGALRPDQASEEPVALETAVIATGARPGDTGARRELFSEETQTVLVFERGAVIRLSAGVADGQLLFLTNKKSGKEVVTQVVRKRSFRPTSCYVDLEFTEASPGFWGIEFPKSAPVLPSQVKNDSGGDEDGDSVKHAAPPHLHEVDRLKKEVAELQSQLKTLTGATTGSDGAPPLPTATANEPATDESLKPKHEETALAQLIAQEAQQEQLHGPQRLVAYPKKSLRSVVKVASKAATVAAVAAVIVAACIAVYRFGLLDSFIAKSSAAKPAPNNTSTNLNSGPATAAKLANPAAVPGNSVAAAATQTAPYASNEQAQNTGGTSSFGNASAKLPFETAPASLDVLPKEARRRSGSGSKDLDGSAFAAGIVPSNSSSNVAEGGSATAVKDFVAPKLIYSVKPVSPPDALRNYVTGNVNVDALVDVTGHVKSVTVLSGPEKLRNTAIAEMKRYVYEPARQNGKPVTAHVQTSLKYWYEP